MHHLCCFAELDDGSVLFSFGKEAEAKAKSAAATSAVPHKDQDQSTSPIRPQTAQGASQANQEQSKPAEGEQTESQSSSKQNLAKSSNHNLQQPALTALQQITASKAKQLAAPAIDPKIIAKYTRLAVIPNLPVSGSTGPSSSSFDARPSVSSIPSQRPSSPAVTVASLSSTGVFDSKAVTQAPSQKPVSAEAAIDPKIIAKYSQRAVIPNLPVFGSTGLSSSSFDARPTVSSIPSQRPSSPAAAIASQSSTGVAGSKAVSQAPVQKPVSAKSAIDPKIIAKYSQRAVIPDLPASGSRASRASSDAGKSVSSVSSQRPSVPAVALASLSSSSSSDIDSSQTVSQAPSQKSGYVKPAIDPKIIAKYSRRAVTADLPASASRPSSSSLNTSYSASKAATQRPISPAISLTSPSSSDVDASESLINASTQRPQSPAVASSRPSSSSADTSKSISQAPSQRPSSPKPPIDPKIIAKYSRRAVSPDLIASRSQGAEFDSRPSSADTSDEEGSSSEAASERLGDMTPQQLQGLKVSACHVAWHCRIALQRVATLPSVYSVDSSMENVHKLWCVGH